MTRDDIKGLLINMGERLNLDHSQLAALLGVPSTTLSNWTQGQRMPSKATLRLIELLGILEVMAPQIHQYLIQEVLKDVQADNGDVG